MLGENYSLLEGVGRKGLRKTRLVHVMASRTKKWKALNRLKQKISALDDEMSKVIGLHSLKLQLQKLAKGILVDEKRRATRRNIPPAKPPHMVFVGNPGTGKTTVARLLGKFFHSTGLLSRDKVIEVQRRDLVAEYIGQTAPKTRKKIDEAMGGILFVDEAYRLIPNDRGRDFGREALEEIMSVLEDGNLSVIFAGYTDPMKGVFSCNEGFCRRVTHFFQFDDFTTIDLVDMLMMKMRNYSRDGSNRYYGFKFHPSCTDEAVVRLIEMHTTETLRSKMNGGLVDHMLTNARQNLDWRVNLEENEDLFTIEMEDLEAGLKILVQDRDKYWPSEEKGSDGAKATDMWSLEETGMELKEYNS